MIPHPRIVCTFVICPSTALAHDHPVRPYIHTSILPSVGPPPSLSSRLLGQARLVRSFSWSWVLVVARSAHVRARRSLPPVVVLVLAGRTDLVQCACLYGPGPAEYCDRRLSPLYFVRDGRQRTVKESANVNALQWNF
ncbi:hypothetical protein FKP32DRAFT_1039477 [Trametes sanguinea]|nr:hypothetical protein FKP32DRAFT_1039477 [Trametes sanguinea]